MSEDVLDKTEFIQYFRDECEELLQQIDSDLLRLEEFIDTGRADAETINSLFRALHTVKGSASMLQFTEVQALSEIPSAHRCRGHRHLLHKALDPHVE